MRKTLLTLTLAAALVSPAAASDLGAARATFKQDQCLALSQLGSVIDKAGGKRDARARKLQRKLFLQSDGCGVGKPTFTVAPKLAAPAGVARMVSAGGRSTLFENRELVLSTNDEAKLRTLLHSYDGKVVKRYAATGGGPALYLIRIDTAAVEPAGLGKDLRKLTPLSRGDFEVSSASGLRTLAAAAEARRAGMPVGLNFVVEEQEIAAGSTTEGALAPGATKAAKAGFTSNAFNWWYVQEGAGQVAVDVGDAWRALEFAGVLPQTRVRAAVLDNGFQTGSFDLSPASEQGDGVEGTQLCTGGTSCPWHGIRVSQALAAVPDNGKGAAGPGGPVADVSMYTSPDYLSTINGIYSAIEDGARVINISMTHEFDAAISALSLPMEWATITARDQGVLVVASAGNDGLDVDAEDCFVACWEEEVWAPCELAGVMCVGGMWSTGAPAGASNYGYDSCDGAERCSVEMFAPWEVYVSSDKAGADGADLARGTSGSAPFVAGVAALVFAADPSLRAAGVEHILKKTALDSDYGHVSRTINAYRAVRAAMGWDNLAPRVEILTPLEGTIVPHGAFGSGQKVKLSAEVLDFEANRCCTVTWFSDRDGHLITGRSGEAALTAQGTHVITAKVTDADGATATDTVTVKTGNTGPKMKINAPGAGQELLRGVTYAFSGEGSDPDQPGGVTCDTMRWTVQPTGGAEQQIGTGCHPQYAFPAAGSYVVELTGADSQGLEDTEQRTVTVAEPPHGIPPVVTILKPTSGQVIRSDQLVVLDGDVVDTDDGEDISGTWSVRRDDGSIQLIGAGNTRMWFASSVYGTGGCGDDHATLLFSATDEDGTATAEQPIVINHGPC